ncbi:hypothetical protein I6H07_06250 [Hafnia alvei]|uniref:hypothetical protein n=1 Tax=Hafnia alvei TaxID=569 RepID=UPI000B6848BC|nr:hypothetical protein [Hafnia alvei]MBI0275436.1 hypothetical protein [Hafnia alvei]PNK98570.1 hypothetical protein CEQ28_013740 [Hafnia alvei]
MKKLALMVVAIAMTCSIAACSNSGYTKVEAADGTVVTHAHVDKGTTVTSDGNGAFTVDANKGPEQQYQVPTAPAQ